MQSEVLGARPEPNLTISSNSSTSSRIRTSASSSFSDIPDDLDIYLQPALVDPSTSALTCLICLSVFFDPVTLECGHTFCRQCLFDALVNVKVMKCPTCRSPSFLPLNRVAASHSLAALVSEYWPKYHQARTKQMRSLPRATSLPLTINVGPNNSPNSFPRSYSPVFGMFFSPEVLLPGSSSTSMFYELPYRAMIHRSLLSSNRFVVICATQEHSKEGVAYEDRYLTLKREKIRTPTLTTEAVNHELDLTIPLKYATITSRFSASPIIQQQISLAELSSQEHQPQSSSQSPPQSQGQALSQSPPQLEGSQTLITNSNEAPSRSSNQGSEQVSFTLSRVGSCSRLASSLTPFSGMSDLRYRILSFLLATPSYMIAFQSRISALMAARLSPPPSLTLSSGMIAGSGSLSPHLERWRPDPSSLEGFYGVLVKIETAEALPDGRFKVHYVAEKVIRTRNVARDITVPLLYTCLADEIEEIPMCNPSLVNNIDIATSSSNLDAITTINRDETNPDSHMNVENSNQNGSPDIVPPEASITTASMIPPYSTAFYENAISSLYANETLELDGLLPRIYRVKRRRDEVIVLIDKHRKLLKKQKQTQRTWENTNNTTQELLLVLQSRQMKITLLLKKNVVAEEEAQHLDILAEELESFSMEINAFKSTWETWKKEKHVFRSQLIVEDYKSRLFEILWKKKQDELKQKPCLHDGELENKHNCKTKRVFTDGEPSTLISHDKETAKLETEAIFIDNNEDDIENADVFEIASDPDSDALECDVFVPIRRKIRSIQRKRLRRKNHLKSNTAKKDEATYSDSKSLLFKPEFVTNTPLYFSRIVSKLMRELRAYSPSVTSLFDPTSSLSGFIPGTAVEYLDQILRSDDDDADSLLSVKDVDPYATENPSEHYSAERFIVLKVLDLETHFNSLQTELRLSSETPLDQASALKIDDLVSIPLGTDSSICMVYIERLDSGSCPFSYSACDLDDYLEPHLKTVTTRSTSKQIKQDNNIQDEIKNIDNSYSTILQTFEEQARKLTSRQQDWKWYLRKQLPHPVIKKSCVFRPISQTTFSFPYISDYVEYSRPAARSFGLLKYDMPPRRLYSQRDITLINLLLAHFELKISPFGSLSTSRWKLACALPSHTLCTTYLYTHMTNVEYLLQKNVPKESSPYSPDQFYFDSLLYGPHPREPVTRSSAVSAEFPQTRLFLELPYQYSNIYKRINTSRRSHDKDLQAQQRDFSSDHYKKHFRQAGIFPGVFHLQTRDFASYRRIMQLSATKSLHQGHIASLSKVFRPQIQARALYSTSEWNDMDLIRSKTSSERNQKVYASSFSEPIYQAGIKTPSQRQSLFFMNSKHARNTRSILDIPEDVSPSLHTIRSLFPLTVFNRVHEVQQSIIAQINTTQLFYIPGLLFYNEKKVNRGSSLGELSPKALTWLFKPHVNRLIEQFELDKKTYAEKDKNATLSVQFSEQLLQVLTPFSPECVLNQLGTENQSYLHSHAGFVSPTYIDSSRLLDFFAAMMLTSQVSRNNYIYLQRKRLIVMIPPHTASIESISTAATGITARLIAEEPIFGPVLPPALAAQRAIQRAQSETPSQHVPTLQTPILSDVVSISSSSSSLENRALDIPSFSADAALPLSSTISSQSLQLESTSLPRSAPSSLSVAPQPVSSLSVSLPSVSFSFPTSVPQLRSVTTSRRFVSALPAIPSAIPSTIPSAIPSTIPSATPSLASHHAPSTDLPPVTMIDGASVNANGTEIPQILIEYSFSVGNGPAIPRISISREVTLPPQTQIHSHLHQRQYHHHHQNHHHNSNLPHMPHTSHPQPFTQSHFSQANNQPLLPAQSVDLAIEKKYALHIRILYERLRLVRLLCVSLSYLLPVEKMFGGAKRHINELERESILYFTALCDPFASAENLNQAIYTLISSLPGSVFQPLSLELLRSQNVLQRLRVLQASFVFIMAFVRLDKYINVDVRSSPLGRKAFTLLRAPCREKKTSTLDVEPKQNFLSRALNCGKKYSQLLSFYQACLKLYSSLPAQTCDQKSGFRYSNHSRDHLATFTSRNSFILPYKTSSDQFFFSFYLLKGTQDIVVFWMTIGVIFFLITYFYFTQF